MDEITWPVTIGAAAFFWLIGILQGRKNRRNR